MERDGVGASGGAARAAGGVPCGVGGPGRTGAAGVAEHARHA